MKNTFGNHISVTLFGESHGKMIGAVIDGLASGMVVDMEEIQKQMDVRRPIADLGTKRTEEDKVEIVSGVWKGKTTGTPLCLLIHNRDVQSDDYDEIRNVPRPGHGDFAYENKYHGFQDPRGGGHGSGRLTAPLVAAGAIVLSALRQKGIVIGSHISRLACVDDGQLEEKIEVVEKLNNKVFPVVDDSVGEVMKEKIKEAANDKDSVGGVLETVVLGLPAGLGEPWFDSVESVLSHGLFSIPGVKGVAFGDGFGMADQKGSEANDCWHKEGNRVRSATNHSGGINGGVTNGLNLRFSCALRPTPSIGREQNSVNLQTGEDVVLFVKGRHDPCIVPRARAAIDSITAIVIADLLCERFGNEYFGA